MQQFTVHRIGPEIKIAGIDLSFTNASLFMVISALLIILLLFLIPLLLLLLIFIGINTYKSKINVCSNCGTISLGFNDTCMNCGTKLENKIKEDQIDKKPSESTIEVKAEEVQ